MEGFCEAHGLVKSEGAPIPAIPATVSALVQTAGERFGSRTAVADRHRSLSFSELEQAVARGAGLLLAHGLQPLDRVAMSLPNGCDAVVAFLAVMRAGLVWVGINPRLAAPEKEFLIEDSGAAVLMSPEPLRQSLPHIHIGPSEPTEWWAKGEQAGEGAPIDPFAPAAIAYTSGTTGRPKGAVHSQHNMLLPAASITATDGGAGSVQGVCLPLTILNMQILATVQTLVSGGTCVAMDRTDVLGVVEFVRDFRVQLMYATPPLVYDLLTRPEIDPSDIVSLDQMGVGGAKVPEGLAERYRSRFGQDFATGYGLTEAPTSVTGTAGHPGALGTSGPSRPHVDVTIRDDAGHILPPGLEGEICVGRAPRGPFAGCYTTMLGYWDRPEATAHALRGGILHTGDIGVLDEDGNLVVKDRGSDLIIRGGANVYPAEVERVVEATGLVAEVAVVGRPHPRLGEEVVAFVSPPGGHSLDRNALDAACRSELAAYKIPVAWYETDSWPRNAMGKVLKPELRRRLAESGRRPL